MHKAFKDWPREPCRERKKLVFKTSNFLKRKDVLLCIFWSKQSEVKIPVLKIKQKRVKLLRFQQCFNHFSIVRDQNAGLWCKSF